MYGPPPNQTNVNSNQNYQRMMPNQSNSNHAQHYSPQAQQVTAQPPAAFNVSHNINAYNVNRSAIQFSNAPPMNRNASSNHSAPSYQPSQLRNTPPLNNAHDLTQHVSAPFPSNSDVRRRPNAAHGPRQPANNTAANVHFSAPLAQQSFTDEYKFAQSNTSFLTLPQARALHMGDNVDYRNDNGFFVCAIITTQKRSNNVNGKIMLQIRPTNSHASVTCILPRDLYRFARAGSISQRPAHRLRHLKVGDQVSVNFGTSGWTVAFVRGLAFDRFSGQVQIQYEPMHAHGQIYTRWTHLDNTNEIVAYNAYHPQHPQQQSSPANARAPPVTHNSQQRGHTQSTYYQNRHNQTMPSYRRVQSVQQPQPQPQPQQQQQQASGSNFHSESRLQQSQNYPHRSPVLHQSRTDENLHSGFGFVAPTPSLLLADDSASRRLSEPPPPAHFTTARSESLHHHPVRADGDGDADGKVETKDGPVDEAPSLQVPIPRLPLRRRRSNPGRQSRAFSKGILLPRSADDEDTNWFKAHMTLQQAQALNVGDAIDYRNDQGYFILSTVYGKHDTQLKIGYNGYLEQWVEIRHILPRLARPGSISQRPASRLIHLQVGDKVSVHVQHSGWEKAAIRRMDDDEQSGQVQVEYKENETDGTTCLYWTHLDNKQEIAEYNPTRHKLLTFYKEHSPQKMDDNVRINEILLRYAGRDDELFAALNRKYLNRENDKCYYVEKLRTMGFSNDKAERAIKVYQDNYGHQYDLSRLTGIVLNMREQQPVRLSQSPKSNAARKAPPPPPQRRQRGQKQISQTLPLKKSDVALASSKHQFAIFLQELDMEEYRAKFETNKCCDMESIKYFDENILKSDIGVESKMLRRKFLAKCTKMIKEMDEFENNCPPLFYAKLCKYGVVTMQLLLEAVEEKKQLTTKFGIRDEEQCNVLWNYIEDGKKRLTNQAKRKLMLVPSVNEEEKGDAINVRNPLVLLIGISDYVNKKKLPGVVVDVEEYRHLWQNGYGYRVLPDKKDSNYFGKTSWTFEDIENFVAEKRKQLMDPDGNLAHDGLIVIINGHGVEGGIVPSDWDPQHSDKKETVQLSYLHLQVSGLWERKVSTIPRIFVIDACRGGIGSGSVAESRGAQHIYGNSCSIYGNSPGVEVKEQPNKGGYFSQCFRQQVWRAKSQNMKLSSIVKATGKQLKSQTSTQQMCWIDGDPFCQDVIFKPNNTNFSLL